MPNFLRLKKAGINLHRHYCHHVGEDNLIRKDWRKYSGVDPLMVLLAEIYLKRGTKPSAYKNVREYLNSIHF